VGNKRKGQLTSDTEWRKHLRKIGKRFFWKGERLAQKEMIKENLSDINGPTEPFTLTFDRLIDLTDESGIYDQNDLKIIECILDAQNDWGETQNPVNSLNDFLMALEKEIGGNVTKKSLKKLLSKYHRNISQNMWEAESVSSLLQVFELTDRTDLNLIFTDLTRKVTIG